MTLSILKTPATISPELLPYEVNGRGSQVAYMHFETIILRPKDYFNVNRLHEAYNFENCLIANDNIRQHISRYSNGILSWISPMYQIPQLDIDPVFRNVVNHRIFYPEDEAFNDFEYYMMFVNPDNPDDYFKPITPTEINTCIPSTILHR